MTREPNKRPRRIPLTSEEVSNFIAYRKRRELIDLQKLKRSNIYKALNVFNVSCIFIYLELLFCYFGPCHYQKHFAINVNVTYGDRSLENGRHVVSEMDLYCVDTQVYKLIVEDFIELPSKKTSFMIGKDYLLQKELKGVLENSNTSYRLFSASPILFLSVFISFVCFVGYHFNLNENAYSLSGMTALNTFTVLGILMF